MNEDLRATSSWPLQQSCLVRALPPGDHQRRPGGKTARGKFHLYESSESNQRCERAPHICKPSNIIKYHSLCYKGLSLSMKWRNMPMSRSSWQPIPFRISLSISSAPHTDPLQWSTAWPVCVLKQLGWKWSTCHMPFKPRQCQNPESFLLNVLKNDENPKRLDSSLTWWIMKFPHVSAIETNPWDNASHHIFSAFSPVTVPCQLPQPALLGTTCALFETLCDKKTGQKLTKSGGD